MPFPFECLHCGNHRPLLPAACPSCGNDDPPFANVEFLKIDLEYGAPSVEEAEATLDSNIRAGAAAGLKGLVVIHGYGSSGSGGKIRKAIREALAGNRWADRIAEFMLCEDLIPGTGDLTRWGRGQSTLLPFLKRNRVLGNPGVTVLVYYGRQAWGVG